MIAADSIAVHRSPGWLAAEQRSPDLDFAGATELLTAVNGPRNGRLTRRGHDVYVLVDSPSAGHEVEELTERIAGLFDRQGDISDRSIDGEELETVLSECGLAWSKREERWVIPAGEGRPELSIELRDGRARTATRVAALDDVGSESREAIHAFLVLAHDSVRFARFEALGEEVVAASYATADRLEIELPHSLRATIAAWRGVVSEVQALTSPELARSYLTFLRGEK